MTCLLCGGPVRKLLDLGEQPVSHDFLTEPGEQKRYPLSAGSCGGCGLAQLIDGPPEEALVPRFDWVRYVEPEMHLDEVAMSLKGRTVTGATYKDDSLVERLKIRGFQKAERADVVVARHVLEHPRDPKTYLSYLASMLNPAGLLLLEVPDSERGFRMGDVTTIWEEHTLYFTEATLRSSLESAGWEVERIDRQRYTMEDCLMAHCRLGKPKPTQAKDDSLENLADEIDPQRHRWKKLLKGKKSAMLGAGHRGAAFLNFLGLSVDFVIDDHPSKAGLLLPGVQKPVRGSDALKDVDVCLISANPDAEAAITKKNDAFLKRGGRFLSIYPDSALAPS